MNMIAATRHCFVNALNFAGRADRYEFWNFVLFLVLASLLLVGVNSLVFGPTITESLQITVNMNGQQSIQPVREALYTAGWPGTIFNIAVLLPLVAVTVRRLHDRNLPGWFVLTPVASGAIAYGLVALTSVAVPIDPTGLPQGAPTEILVPGSPLAFFAAWLIALAGCLFLLISLVRGSKPGPNRFGPHIDGTPA